MRWLALVGIWLLQGGTVGADGGPADRLTAYPAEVSLRGPDAAQQLAVAGPDGADLTDVAAYASDNAKVAEVDSGGTVWPRGEGDAVVTIRHGAATATVAVHVRDLSGGDRPVHFANQVVPIFTRYGCNSGGCHGKASGQNGFKLSLLGFEPEQDYDALVKEGRGRRLFPAAPERSLLLLKSAGQVPHGGGRKLEPGSHDYRLIVRWIGAGMPVGAADAPTVARVEVAPGNRTLALGAAQQLVVTAHYSDGSTEDVTRWAQYQSNEPDVAVVDDRGRVQARDLSGQAAVMARFQGRVAVFRATVPTGRTASVAATFPADNPIDATVAKQWVRLGIDPSDPCSDAEFLRRAALDITGTLPTPAEVREFLNDTDPNKRAKRVDRLLDRPEYAQHIANKWAAILKNQREGNAQLQHATYRFHDWIARSLAANLPYDRFARAVLAATGSVENAPAVAWTRKLRTPDAFVDDTAQVFLGMRLQCAKCHHHPFEGWSQDDYYGFAAFFGRIGRKATAAARRSGRNEEAIFAARTGQVSHPRTGKAMEPKPLGGEPIAVPPGDDPRDRLVGWLTEPGNPYFARAVVNRYWAHFFGRGVVEPLDDMRVSNPPTNPELLDALADDFIRSGYDLKHLVRTICNSRVYGLSSVPNESNAADRQSFARFYPRRLPAEVLLDAIAQVTGVPTPFGGLPAGTRAIALPDESIGSSFLDTFGRPKRDTACECERVTDASLGQSLLLLNSNELQARLADGNGRAAALAKEERPDAEKVADLFLAAFGREPTAAESARALAHIEQHKDQRQQAFEDIVWALVNAKEFQFND